MLGEATAGGGGVGVERRSGKNIWRTGARTSIVICFSSLPLFGRFVGFLVFFFLYIAADRMAKKESHISQSDSLAIR